MENGKGVNGKVAGWGLAGDEYVFAGERMGRTSLRSRKTKMMTATEMTEVRGEVTGTVSKVDA